MANLKQITKGIAKYRGGLANKSGKKFKVSDFQETASVGQKFLTFTANIKSENPRKADKDAKKFETSQKKKIQQLKDQLKAKGTPASRKKEIRLEIQRRQKNIRVNKGTKDGAGNPAKEYKVSVIFDKMDFKDEKTSTHTKSVKALGKDSLVWYKPPTPTSSVKMRCTCPDFRHSFSHQLADAGSLAVGKPTGYFRVTPAINGPKDKDKTFERPNRPKNPNPFGHDFVNPKDEVGFCKHIFRFLQVLKTDGKFKEK
jgi:hypothetical protein